MRPWREVAEEQLAVNADSVMTSFAVCTERGSGDYDACVFILRVLGWPESDQRIFEVIVNG